MKFFYSDLVREHQSDIIIVLGDKEEGKTIQSFMQILIVLKRPSNDNAITKDELNRLNNACLIDIFKSEDCYPPDNRVSIGFGGHFMFVLNLWIDKHDMINKIKTLYG